MATCYTVHWQDGINVRAAPSLDAEVVSTLDFGSPVQVLELQDNWARHAAGWSMLIHTPSGLPFLCPPEEHAAAPTDYLQQRAALEGHEALDRLLAVHDDTADEQGPPDDCGKAWAVLVCGGTRGSHYGKPNRPWKDLGGDIPFLTTLGALYEQVLDRMLLPVATLPPVAALRCRALLPVPTSRPILRSLPLRSLASLLLVVSLVFSILNGAHDQVSAEVGPERVVVIAGLEDAREWLRGMVQHGYSKPFDAADDPAARAFYGDLQDSKRKWKERLLHLELSCRT